MGSIPGTDYLITGHTDKMIRLWNKSDLCPVNSYKCHKGSINSIAVTSNGILFTGDSVGGIGIFQLSKGSLQVCRSPGQIPDHNNEITCMVTSFDMEYLFTADKDGLLVKWHIKIPIARVSDDLRIENGIWSMCVTPNSKFLVTGGLGEINVLSIYPKKNIAEIEYIFNNGTPYLYIEKGE